MIKPWWKSTTIWGAIITAVAHVVSSSPEQRVQAAVEGAGVVTAAWGARTAIARNGTGQ